MAPVAPVAIPWHPAETSTLADGTGRDGPGSLRVAMAPERPPRNETTSSPPNAVDRPPASRIAALRLAAAGAFYLLLALVVTWPAVVDPGHTLIGHTNGDEWYNLWGYTWFRDELLAGRFPFHVRPIAHPIGGTLYYLDMLDALVAAPWLGLLGPVATYDGVVWFNLVLAGLGAFVLVRHLTGSLHGGLLAGVVYGFSPYLLAVVSNGITENLTAGWLPLFLYALIRLGETRRWRHAALAGVAMNATVMACLYHGLYAAMIGGLVVGYGLVLRRPRWPLAVLPRLALTGALVVALCGPLYMMLQASRDEGTSVVSARPPLPMLDDAPHWRTHSMVTDPANLLLPGKPAEVARRSNTVNHVTYFGWILLAAVGAAMVLRRRSASGPARGEAPPLAGRRERLFWLGCLLFFLVLSLGQHLRFAGETVTLGGRVLALPTVVVDAVMPGAGLGELKYRYFVVVTLCAAVLAGWGWTALASRLPPGRRRWATGVAIVVLLGETWIASPARVPVATASAVAPAYYRELGASTEELAVIDLPTSRQIRFFGRYLYFTAVHGKGVPYTVERSIPAELNDQPLFRDLEMWSNGLAGDAPFPDSIADAGVVADEWGYRWAVVHRSLAADLASDPAAVEAALAMLEERFGAPVHEDGEVVVFSLADGE